MNTLLSIVIPTKNRYNCLLPVLDTLLKNIQGTNYEIIVQDNSDDNNLINRYLEEKLDNRIKYFYTKEHLDIVQNCNKGIDNAIGKYVCMIGDDDLVSPYIMKIIKILEENDIKCLTYTSGNYLWPEVLVTNRNKYNSPSTLTLYNNYSTKLTTRYSKEEMDRVLNMGGIYFLALPRLYHGIVRKDVLVELKHKFGNQTYFPGPSPDMSISAALSILLENYHYMHYPVTITGVSFKSGAGMGVRNAHVGLIEDQEFLPSRTKEIWDKYIPRIWTGFTIYAESLHEVFDSAGLGKRVNYLNLYAAMYQHEAYTRKYIKPVAEHYCRDNNLNILEYKKACLSRLPRRIFGSKIEALKRILRKNIAVQDIQTVEECMTYLLQNTLIN